MSSVVELPRPLPAFDIVQVAGRIGAEVSGFRMSGTLAAAPMLELRQQLLRHKVLFFREQHDLDGDGLVAFARQLGELVPAPWPHGTDFLSEVRGRTNNWHTDMTFSDAYPAFGILRAVVIPAFGGDTVWANTAAAYKDLPAALRALADRVWALHTNDYRRIFRGSAPSREQEKFFTKLFDGTIYETEHPLVRVHPETGERSLLLGNFVYALKDFPQPAAAQTIDLLQSYVTRLENTVRWRWRVGDVAIWDNRATQHYAIDDYGSSPRMLQRVTVAGEAPVDINGRTSCMRH